MNLSPQLYQARPGWGATCQLEQFELAVAIHFICPYPGIMGNHEI